MILNIVKYCQIVVNVAAAVMVLLSNKTKKIPKDRSWNAAKVMMGKVRSSSKVSE